MAKTNSKQKEQGKQLIAKDVHQLVSTTLQAHFKLNMDDRNYNASDIWDVLIAACVQRISIEMASKLIENAPSGTMTRTIIKDMLTAIGQFEQIEANMNEIMVSKLPKKLLKSKLPVAIDVTELPYHGKYEPDDEMVRRGRAKSGTTHFFSFATLYVIKKHKRIGDKLSRFRNSQVHLLNH